MKYELASPPSRAVTFEDYSADCQRQFHALIDSEPSESEIQSFLERHPCLVPNPRSLGAFPSATAMDGLLVAQPKLQGSLGRVPDFMWLSINSEACIPAVVEVERPVKRWFTRAGTPTAEFTQARHQLSQWKAWFDRPENVAQLVRDYPLPRFLSVDPPVTPMYVLVYGRRAEFEHDAKLASQRASLLTAPAESIMTYDRLRPDPWMVDAITVKSKGLGRFQVVAVPPTFTLGPNTAHRLRRLDGLREAVRACSEIEPERRRFLVERIDYWKEWARTHTGMYSIRAGDRE